MRGAHKIVKCSTCGDVDVIVENKIFEPAEHNSPSLIPSRCFRSSHNERAQQKTPGNQTGSGVKSAYTALQMLQ